MAEFSKLVTTKKGQALIAKNWAGTAERPSFTKIAASQQALKVEDLEELTALDIVQEAEVSRVTRTNEVAVMVETAFSNKGLTTGYHMRVLGLYALDPDEGEILYSAAVELSGNDWMPPYNGVTVTGAYIQLISTVGNSEDVSLMVNPAALATIADINELRKLIADIQAFIGIGGEGGWGEEIREHLKNQQNPHKVTAAQIQYEGKPLSAFLKSLEEVASTDRAIQIIPTQYGTLTYTGEEQALTLNGYNATTTLLAGVTRATEAGEYKALATPKHPYYWGADGSTNTKEISWTIGRKPVELPTQTNSLIYTGEEQAPTFEGIQSEIMTLGGELNGTDAGTYTATVELDNNYQWPDGSHGTFSLEWEIARITLETVPSQDVPLTYTGAEQSPTWGGYDGNKMTMTGPTSATGAGSYTVEVTPGPNYQWPDGSNTTKDVLWTIAKAPGRISVNKTTVELKASAMSALITVTRPGDGVISASSSNPAAATVSVSGNAVSLTAKAKGSATITISVAEGTNHTAPTSKTVRVTVTLPSATLKDNSWATIQDVITGGQEANFWSVGDVKPVTLNGTVGGFTFSNTTIEAFILGFNHNASREGNKRTHFLLGKLNGKDVALCDSQYSKGGSGAGFRMNTTTDNTGGWGDSYMRKSVLGNSGTPANPPANSLLSALPADLRAVISGTTKYTDNTGGNSNMSSYVTATTDYLFALAEFEVSGTQNYANIAEQNFQKQYDYFKAGNSKFAHDHAAVDRAVWWWLRSPDRLVNGHFCIVMSVNSLYGEAPHISGGIRAGFSISGAV